MLKKRIIPCLDIRNGRTVKGVHFTQIRDAGDPVDLAQMYAAQGADELVFLDITATIEKRQALLHMVERVARQIDIPFTVGGGISMPSDVDDLLSAGADKVSINSAAVLNPELIEQLAGTYGSQCIVVAVDTCLHGDTWQVVTHGGRNPTSIKTIDWVQQAAALGAGEILLTSMDHDGTKQGFALDLLHTVCAAIRIPVIASGGAGQTEHFIRLFLETPADAALAASVFHYGEIHIPQLKESLKAQNIPIR